MNLFYRDEKEEIVNVFRKKKYQIQFFNLKMKLIYKILIANIIIAVVITTIALLLTGSGYSSGDDTAVAFGIVCLGIGILNLFVGFILLFTQ